MRCLVMGAFRATGSVIGWAALAAKDLTGRLVSLGRCAATRLQRADDFFRFREPLRRLFREDETAVGYDVELSSATDGDLGVEAKRVFDGGRQTGGLRQIVSNLTIADGDVHARDVTAALRVVAIDAHVCATGRRRLACIPWSACESLSGMEDWIGSVRGVVLDLDGTVYDDGGLFDGAADAIAALRAAGLGVKFATNASLQPRSTLIERLRRQGVDADPEDMFTAPRAAAAWLADQGMTRVSLHVSPMTVEEFAPFTIDEQKPEAVVLGDLGDEWTVERLNRIFRHVIGGAQLLAIQKNRYWKRGGGLCLDAGPFVAAIEYATDTSAVVAGKPSAEFFGAASASMGISPAELVVVGDDVRTDVCGAQSAGARGVLVKTGKFRASDLDDTAIRPDFIIDDIGQLPAALRLKWTSA